MQGLRIHPRFELLRDMVQPAYGAVQIRKIDTGLCGAFSSYVLELEGMSRAVFRCAFLAHSFNNSDHISSTLLDSA
jgi:hypothetical protein